MEPWDFVFGVAIIGLSKSGKTLLGTGLTRALVSRGYSVCAVKHMRGHDFSGEKEGSDTHRYAAAGAGPVLAVAGNGVWDTRKERPVDDLAAAVKGDLHISEGKAMYDGAVTVVCVERAEDIRELWRVREPFPEPAAFSGRIAETMTTFLGKPVYHPTEEVEMLADLVLQKREKGLGLEAPVEGELL